MKRIVLLFFIIMILVSLLIKDFVYGLIIKYDYNINVPNKVLTSFYNEEYIFMKNILDINVDKYNYIYSKVLYRNIYNFYNEIAILKGSNDQLKKDMLVINEHGLVGIIKNVYKNHSIVNLLTKKEINISVKVNNSYGILKSIDNSLYVTNLTEEDDYLDKIVYTSDLSKYLPNIIIGKVSYVENDKSGMFKLKIESKALDNLKYVIVLGNYD